MDWPTAQRDWIGAVVVVGLTYVDAGGELLRQEQLHGLIISVDPTNGIELDLSGKRMGERYWLPPELGAFEAARPGEYRLRSTGEVVRDPDLLSNWTLQAPADS
ncbi:hypothetical protein D3C73_01590 [compost metagenome]